MKLPFIRMRRVHTAKRVIRGERYQFHARRIRVLAIRQHLDLLVRLVHLNDVDEIIVDGCGIPQFNGVYTPS